MLKVGADKADFIVAQTSDRDAGCFEVASPPAECAGRGNGPFYWDETNVATPNFHQDLDAVEHRATHARQPADPVLADADGRALGHPRRHARALTATTTSSTC